MDKAKLYSASEKAIGKGQYEKGLESLEQILRADPNDLKALNRAADVHLKLENSEKAIDYLKRIGTVYSKDGFYSKSVAVYKRILKIDTASAKSVLIGVHEQLATLYGQLGLVSDAMGHFSIVVDFYDQIGEQEQLLQVLKKVSDLDPFNIDSQLRLATLFLSQGKEENAAATMEQLSENIKARGHMPDIIGIYEKWFELFPKKTEKLEELVQLYNKAGEPKKALARIQIAFRSDPKDPQVLELLSLTFRAMKQFDKGKAVDAELLKIYRSKDEAEKAFAVEERLTSKGPDSAPEAAPAPGRPVGTPSTSSVVSLDAGEALIQSLQMDPDERKILAECDVYLKYGLTEKSHEVLTSKLGQFPQSLALRWKLKAAAQELQKTEEMIHMLSEIVLLARNKKLEAWVRLASSELHGLDTQHPALIGTPSEPKGPAAPVRASFAEPSLIQDMERSEISIVVEEESLDDNSVSEISFKDLGDSSDALAKITKTPAPAPVKAEAPPKPAPVKKAVEVREEVEVSDQPLELSMIEEPSGQDALLLSEADFTPQELDQLSDNLVPEASKAKVQKPAKVAPKPAATEAAVLDVLDLSESDSENQETRKVSPEELVDLTENIKNPMHLSIMSEDSSEVLSDEDFEVRQGLEEVDFFKTQGLKEEAEALLKSLKEKFPDHSEWQKGKKSGAGESAGSKSSAKEKAKSSSANSKLRQKSVEMETLGTKVKLMVQEDERDDVASSEFYDLAGELNAELSAIKPNKPEEIRDVFNAFKKGVSQSVAAEDWQTHLDLGIAYREMGLIDDAIEAFQLVSKVPAQKVSAFYQIGISEASRDNFEVAKDYLDKALKEPSLEGTEKLSISYELAEVLMRMDDPSRAKTLFDEVKKLDPEFREIDDKIVEVTQKLKRA